ncbi:MarR family winged helix-turn-helix transcriptional regulator [Plastoroseomonas hellenica]|uniref:MarR family winged helix-turn-helix transcriptional regulator n=1 Tax=Plastoroseomonas hellenica TaxID=2687306 RepID=UPI001BA7B9CB|nr:MarR family winged helix-turn-helix transcriptional regulator [Plastoroseomonas hellenica]MBR0645123.1 winged helix-turn-helix transcriptional regulator [Plastoroseomonas hellenica]
MPHAPGLSPDTVARIAKDCLCLRVQRASRAVGRRFDEVLRPVGLNNWQFSLLMTLHQPSPPTINGLAEALGMDRTTTTKNLKPLERRGLLEIRQDREDARIRRILLTDAGRVLLAEAARYWQDTNDAIAARLEGTELAGFRSALEAIARD